MAVVWCVGQYEALIRPGHSLSCVSVKTAVVHVGDNEESSAEEAALRNREQDILYPISLLLNIANRFPRAADNDGVEARSG
jgi:hypothetical protein